MVQVQKGLFHIIIGIPVNAHFRTNAGEQGVVAMGEKSTPVFEYLAEEVPVFREVGGTKAHYSKVSMYDRKIVLPGRPGRTCIYRPRTW